jgi:hypothetical protein
VGQDVALQRSLGVSSSTMALRCPRKRAAPLPILAAQSRAKRLTLIIASG